MTKPRRNRRRKGTLHIIGGLLIASAIIRVTSTGQVVAESVATNSGMPQPAEMTTNSDPDIAALLEALQTREERIQEREYQLADRMQALRVAEAEVKEQLVALKAAEESLKSTLALADAASESDLQRLTRVYENMKPKDAAKLFEQMSPEFSAGFLGLMEPVAAAAVMTLMSPESAYSVSAVLAGRNANVPKE